MPAAIWAGLMGEAPPREESGSVPIQAGIVFCVGLIALIGALVAGRTVFRAVSIALAIVVATSVWHPATRPDLKKLWEGLGRIAQGAAPLVAAAGSVGIILGMVTLTRARHPLSSDGALGCR